MLKALELNGFKSFADKTRFEFPEGITVVVGPNGSGKSNIVDAIKWALGAQSAKSLRGKEMSDVIFKGGGTSGRRAMNTAEATIIFDNSDSRLPVDADEVRVTRRVYRSGEGEYMINGQPCRLRDIKDLFSGTGVGADAYSLIEQGKVDTLLLASARERRAIFEEAAGISRFKAKKLEAQRRLERVDHNLLRLSDIVEEVEGRLRSVRSQASKARRYREYSSRLQELRTQVGLVDWRHLAQQMAAIESELTQLRDQAQEVAAQVELTEAKSLQIETDVDTKNEEIHRCESQIAGNRERLASHESAVEHQRRLVDDLDEEDARFRAQVVALSRRAGDLKQQLEETVRDVVLAEQKHREIENELNEHEQSLDGLTQQLDAARGDTEGRRGQYAQKMRARSELANEIGAFESQSESAAATARRCEQQLDELQRTSDTLAKQHQTLQAQELEQAEQAEQQTIRLRDAENDLQRLQRQSIQVQQELAQLRGRRTGVRERTSVLEELERRLEGVSAGAKEILKRAEQEPEGPLAGICGLVADLVEVNVEAASMVEIALGDSDQHLVVEGEQLLAHLQSEPDALAHRVGFVPLTAMPPPGPAGAIDLTGQKGVIGRADRFVQTQPRYVRLIHRLLCETWFVKRLSDAVALSRSTGTGLRFVTAAGEVLDRDGSFVVGPRHSSAGIISRRSELRALAEQLEKLDQQITDQELVLAQLTEEIETRQTDLEQLTQQHRQAADTLAQHRLATQATRQKHEQATQQCETLTAELSDSQARQGEASTQLEKGRARLTQMDATLAASEAEIQKDTQRLDELETGRQQQLRQVTDTKVEFAKSEQRLEGLRATQAQYEQHRTERDRVVEENRQQLAHCTQRRQEAQRAILRATSAIAELYLHKELFAAQTVQLTQQREQLVRDKAALGREVQQLRQQIHQLEERQHKKELDAGEVRHEANTLTDRLREDYGIELDQLQQQPTGEELDEREGVDEEIASLRRKISNIGAVNMDALNELDDLDTRFTSLSSQYQDLISAKESLGQIISKINTDSRRLFIETLDAVRTNFQTLFRKVFGGGHSDIVLEEGVDVLESGVEIVATPPGKQSLNISLLSGGERALTAVTLLLAIFQYRPSPFCVLDEVDGPLDEANIDRFVSVLKDFLNWTKFVVVTHSKKTMTAATTLYGVTMQESGVSKRVSVRFDDVSETGHISPAAIEREEDANRGAA
jgi:chromosome segregation protein